MWIFFRKYTNATIAVSERIFDVMKKVFEPKYFQLPVMSKLIRYMILVIQLWLYSLIKKTILTEGIRAEKDSMRTNSDVWY